MLITRRGEGLQKDSPACCQNERETGELCTFIQQSASSPTRLSRRLQRAAVHCGAVTLVGSVRTRDLYNRLCGAGAESVISQGSQHLKATRV